MVELSSQEIASLSAFPTSYFTDIYRAWGLGGIVQGLSALDGSRPSSIGGRALTARFMPIRGRSGSDMKLYDVIDSGRPGDFLVIEAPYPEVVVGDLVTACAHAAGFLGILVDGWTRDAHAVSQSPVGVWSRGQEIARPGGFELVSYGEAVVCGGAQVHTGDGIVADQDGAVVVPPQEFEALSRALPLIHELEEELGAAVADRRSVSEIHELFRRKGEV